MSIIESFMAKSTCAYTPLPLQDTQTFPTSETGTHTCEVCERVFVGKYQWEAHMKSHRHKRVLERKKRHQKEAKCNS